MDEREDDRAVEEGPEAEGLPTGAGTPEAITEQPDLHFEHENEAKWLGDPMGLRLLAVAITARRRRARDGGVSPTPWLAIAVTAMIAVTAIAVLALVVRVLT